MNRARGTIWHLLLGLMPSNSSWSWGKGGPCRAATSADSHWPARRAQAVRPRWTCRPESWRPMH